MCIQKNKQQLCKIWRPTTWPTTHLLSFMMYIYGNCIIIVTFVPSPDISIRTYRCVLRFLPSFFASLSLFFLHIDNSAEWPMNPHFLFPFPADDDDGRLTSIRWERKSILEHDRWVNNRSFSFFPYSIGHTININDISRSS